MIFIQKFSPRTIPEKSMGFKDKGQGILKKAIFIAQS
jgi:hypothetical protein